MHPCSDCDLVAKSAAGLASHVRAKHPSDDEGRDPNSAALEVTLSELERLGRLEKIDRARVQSVQSMARSLDIDPFNAQMWRQYREALEDLVAADDGIDDSLTEALKEIASAG